MFLIFYYLGIIYNTEIKWQFFYGFNIEEIERLECLTMFTEVASKLSGKLHFVLNSAKIKKINGNVTVKIYLNKSLLSLLCFIIYGRGSFEKGLM